MSAILGLLLLAVYIAAVVGLAALITYGVIRLFPTERGPKKPSDSDGSSSGREPQSGGKLFRSAKRSSA